MASWGEMEQHRCLEQRPGRRRSACRSATTAKGMRDWRWPWLYRQMCQTNSLLECSSAALVQMWLTSPKPRPKERVSLECVPREQTLDYASGGTLALPLAGTQVTGA